MTVCACVFVSLFCLFDFLCVYISDIIYLLTVIIHSLITQEYVCKGILVLESSFVY